MLAQFMEIHRGSFYILSVSFGGANWVLTKLSGQLPEAPSYKNFIGLADAIWLDFMPGNRVSSLP